MIGPREDSASTGRPVPHDVQDDATVAITSQPLSLALASAVITDGSVIGGWRLLREIGSGGMGSVFLAEREDREFRHQAAIKIVRGFPTAEILERFRRERELLATLRHPNIARLFDGGTTAAGQPYLVMEYVDGMPLDEWVRVRRPTLRQRLRLFQSLCAAVQGAHQQLIVHRDLKPGNVLVRGDGEPVLLDFGIGKLLGESESPDEATLFQALTPAYASPEQLRGGIATTLSDIYGLGLILFELLTGVALRKQKGDTTRLMPSSLATTGEDWLRADARLLRGDLDNIVRKALREEPERRYASAAALSADIEAWFQGRPVDAAPDSWTYRLRKFVARHPVSLGATVAALVALSVLSLRLAAERDRALALQEEARLEAEGANQSAEFLVALFDRASPEVTRGRELGVRELIRQAGEEMAGRDFNRPEVKARLQTALGRIYISLGLSGDAATMLESAVALARHQEGGADPHVLIPALRHFARACDLLERDSSGLAAATEALELARRHLAADDLEIAHVLQTLGVAEENQDLHEQALAHFREAEQRFIAAGPEHTAHVGAALHNQGWALSRHGRDDEALPILERAMQLKREALGDRHPSLLYTLDAMGRTRAHLRDFEGALKDLRASLELAIQVLGQPSARVAASWLELGSLLQDIGRYEEAEQAYLASIEQHREVDGEGSAAQAIAINNLATLLEDMGRFDEAAVRFRQALAMRIAGGANPRAIARGQANLARLLVELDADAEATEMAEAAWIVREPLTPADLGERLDSQLLLARLDVRAGRLDAARRRIAQVRTDAGDIDGALPQIRARLAQSERELALADSDAAAAREALEREREALREFLPAGHWRLRRLEATARP